MKLTETHYIHAFNLLPQFGPVRLQRLQEYFGSFARAFSANPSELEQAGLGPNIVQAWVDFRKNLDLAKSMANLESNKIKICIYTDKDYPKLLASIEHRPPILYYRGSLPQPEENCLAVVGTRHITDYGKMVMPKLVGPLAQYGLVIVSGLAIGVDALAHQIALDNHGRTIAVLAGGIDDASISPGSNFKLACDILNSGGALISEYPPGKASWPQHFVVRNRIIAGLSLGTLVIECKAKSGALITAKCAKKEKRKIYAVPGPISAPFSAGPINLLRAGAKAVTCAEDIWQDLSSKNKPLRKKLVLPANLLPVQLKILKLIHKRPCSFQELISITNLPTSELTAMLTTLEIKGLIVPAGIQQYTTKG
jgi:DNA processing protein